MRKIEIRSFPQLHDVIETYDPRTIMYRGMKSASFPLLPKIGRIVPPESIGSREKNEQEILRLFKERAFQYLDFTPANDWDWLALGQQYGLPTRLLDWTDNPLVACFFAVEGSSKDDAVIYACKNNSYIAVDKHPDPFKYRQVGTFTPRHLTRRITTQGGMFTIHPDPYKHFESEDMDKIIIPNQIRTKLKRTLNKYGVNKFSLFPSLDGAAAYIEWLQSKQD